MVAREGSWMIEIIGTMKAQDPPTTVGNRVPKSVCKNVLIP